jgi:hypothetical protein
MTNIVSLSISQFPTNLAIFALRVSIMLASVFPNPPFLPIPLLSYVIQRRESCRGWWLLVVYKNGIMRCSAIEGHTKHKKRKEEKEKKRKPTVTSPLIFNKT